MNENPTSLDPTVPVDIPTQSALDRANQLKQAAADRAKALSNTLSTQTEKIKEVATKQGTQLKDTATVQLDATKVKLKEVSCEVESYVKENPTKSAAIAFGAGILIGLMFRK